MTLDLNQFLREWADALDSGDYPQGKDCLARRDPETGEPVAFCCLGVGAEVGVRHGLLQRVPLDYRTDMFAYVPVGSDHHGESDALPRVLAEMVAPLEDHTRGDEYADFAANPVMPDHPLTPRNEFGRLVRFAIANDEYNLPFATIAQILRETWLADAVKET